MLFRLQTLLDSPYVLGGVAVAALVLIAWWLIRRQPKIFPAFETGGGTVLITRKAVKELVQRCCEEFAGVGSARARIKLHRDEVNVLVELRVRRDANARGLSNYLREQINVALTENLGLAKVGDIAITIVGVLEDDAKDR